MNFKEKKLLYLACPFTHPDPVVRDYRYRTSCRVAAQLMRSGIAVFNPLSHSVPVCKFVADIEDQHSFWMSVDLPILRRCNEILVLGLEGWTTSNGVRSEIFEAIAHAKPVTQIEEADIDLLPLIPKTVRRFLKSDILKEVADV